MRAEKFLKNSGISVLVQLMAMVLAFVTRRVFVEFLPVELLGYQSLFSDVLSLLSMADIGIGSVILYNLYREMADNNQAQIRKFIEINKHYYRIVAAVVTILGFAVIPLLPCVIKGEVTEGWGFLLKIYLLQLLSVVSGYLFSYRSTIYTADQKAYVCAVYGLGGQFVQQCAQIAVLALTRSYVLFLCVRIVIQMVQNLLIFWMAGRDYGYLREPCKVTKADAREVNLLKDAKDYAIHQISFFIYGSTDNFLISALIGIRETALHGNYYTVEHAVITLFLGKILSPLRVAVGHYVYSEQPLQRQKDVFEMLNFTSFLLGSFVAVCFWTLYQPFITLWLGSQYLLPFSFAAAVAMKLYLQLTFEAMYLYRAAYGAYDQDKNHMIWAAIVNLLSSVCLLKIWGITGVKIGTILGLAIIVLGRIRFVFRRYPEFSKKEFMKTQGVYFAVFLLDLAVTCRVADFLPDTLPGFAGKTAICLLVPNLIHLTLFYKTKEWKLLMQYARRLLEK